MNVKALMLGLALVGFSAVGAHATIVANSLDFTPISGGNNNVLPLAPQSAVPEPVTWALMLMGFGGIGAAVRSARRRSATA